MRLASLQHANATGVSGLVRWLVRFAGLCGSLDNSKPNHPIPWAQAVNGLVVWFADCQNGNPLSLLDFVLVGLPPDQTQFEER